VYAEEIAEVKAFILFQIGNLCTIEINEISHLMFLRNFVTLCGSSK
jgi:hypothetical protein